MEGAHGLGPCMLNRSIVKEAREMSIQKWAGVAGALVLVLVLLGMGASYHNQEVALRNQTLAQQRNAQQIFDKTWKVIQQTAGVTEEYREAFTQVYPELMEGRYGNARGGALLSFVQESNPEFSTKLYEKLADQIEALRAEFAREQTQLLDLQREHRNLLAQVPSSLFLLGRQPVEVQIITSGKAEKAYSTGMEDDIDLFKKQDKDR